MQKSLTFTALCLSTLYDILDCQLRALESLRVTTDKCSAILFPLVESGMPEELRSWQRSNNGTLQMKDKLEKLMSFMKMEVENKERVVIAKANFKAMSVRDEETKQRLQN